MRCMDCIVQSCPVLSCPVWGGCERKATDWRVSRTEREREREHIRCTVRHHPSPSLLRAPQTRAVSRPGGVQPPDPAKADHVMEYRVIPFVVGTVLYVLWSGMPFCVAQCRRQDSKRPSPRDCMASEDRDVSPCFCAFPVQSCTVQYSTVQYSTTVVPYKYCTGNRGAIFI